jgi:NAD(P)-dependent dehydrogenase (short-subunit alcohol dehydrogenase family)
MSIFREQLLKGKTALVTGGGSGIGQRMAERFAEHGARVMVIGRKQEKLDAAVAHNAFGEIDIVVCGAAGNFPAPVLGMSANGFKAVIDIDLLGTFNTCRAAYAHLRKPGASVIAISASFAFQPTASQAHVGAAKAGIDILIKTLAIEWGPSGVRCNCITPGPTDDTEGMRRLAPDDASRNRVERSVPLRRFGTKDELADLALFLCSDAASFITGGIYLCDGGMSLSRPSEWLQG